MVFLSSFLRSNLRQVDHTFGAGIKLSGLISHIFIGVETRWQERDKTE